MNLQVYSGAMNGVISKFRFFLIFLLLNQCSGVLSSRKASHSSYLRPLCRGGFREGISERSKLESDKENRTTCSSAFISYPGWSALGSLSWVWINPFKPRKGFWWVLWGCWKVVAEPRKMQGFLASSGEEINPGPETRLDWSEFLCNKVLLKYRRDRESFWHRHQKGDGECPCR